MVWHFQAVLSLPVLANEKKIKQTKKQAAGKSKAVRQIKGKNVSQRKKRLKEAERKKIPPKLVPLTNKNKPCVKSKKEKLLLKKKLENMN